MYNSFISDAEIMLRTRYENLFIGKSNSGHTLWKNILRTRSFTDNREIHIDNYFHLLIFFSLYIENYNDFKEELYYEKIIDRYGLTAN